MKQLPANINIAYLMTICGGVLVSLLGLSVLTGWHTQNVTLIQVSAAFVPMQYNTALGFLLSGLGLLIISRGHSTIGTAISILTAFIGLLTLAEYILGISIGIDQLLMQHDITVKTSHPGRMAPNTALCFLLVGTALASLSTTKILILKPSVIAGVLGSLSFGLGFVALAGYQVGMETAYGWGQLTRMAVHTAAGFTVLGITVISLAWFRSDTTDSELPSWLPAPVGISILTIMVSMWQAIASQETNSLKQNGGTDIIPLVNDAFLSMGILLAAAFAMTTYLAQAARRREQHVETINLRLASEIDERKAAEKTLRESEERWNFALEGAGDGVWDWDIKTNEIFFSSRWKKMLGYEENEIRNEFDEWDKRVHPEDKEQCYADINRHINGETSYYINEHRLLCKDGNYKWILDRGKVVSWTDDHKPRRMIGTHTDISERKQTEMALRRAQKMDAVGQLTGGIAHDFNNILGIILGNLELLMRQVQPDDNTQKRIQTIHKSAQRAATLTRQLLNFSRHQSENDSLTSINQLISKMEELITRSVTPQVEIKHDFSPELWKTMINPGDFEDVLLNIVLNARDAMEGRGRLTIETENVYLDDAYCKQNPGVKAGEYISVVISDSGKGMTSEQSEHIFEPFYTTKELGKGTGMGLAMVYGFIKRSSGHIKVYSEIDVGTSFRIYLPRAIDAEQTEEQTGDQTLHLPRGTETLLVVDDEQALQEMAQEMLQSLGYRVLTASGGHEALKMLAENTDIRLMFSDVVMPGGINGYELAEQATATRPELLVLLASGFTEKTAAHNGQARFDKNFLSKPYTHFELAKKIHEMLDSNNAKGVGEI